MSASPSSGYPPTAYPASRSAPSNATADAGVSSPTALPTRECRVGYDDSTIANRLS